jgi:opacity protein-like surface antigen
LTDLIKRLTVITCLAAAASVARAQDTATVHIASPYSDLHEDEAIFLTAGYFGGNRGQAGVGPQGSGIVGLGFLYHLGGPAGLIARLQYANSTRDIVDTLLPPATRYSGPSSAPLVLFDVDFLFDVTGEKTWHRLVPTAGFGLGLAFGDNNLDAGGYKFGTKFYFALGGGVKYALKEPWVVRADAWLYFWQLSYPTSYFTAGATPVLPPTAPDKDWTTNGVLSLGISYSLKH